MVFWSRPKSSPIIRRSGVHYKPLTSEEAWQILDSPIRSGYTYAQSASYCSSYPTEYTNPTFGHITEYNYQTYSDDSQSITSSVYLGFKQTISNIVSFFYSMISCLAGLIYYIISGQFLFENLQSTEAQGVMTRRQQQQLEQKKKRWSWLWWLMALLLLAAVLYYGFAWHSPDESSNFCVENLHSKPRAQEINYENLVDNKLRNMIIEIVKNMSYEKTGEPDYALESSGGFVVSTRCTEEYDEFSRRESIFGFPLWFTSYSPRSVIQRQSQNINAGECWAVKGSQAYLVIQLAKRINVTAVSYEHLPKHLSLTGTIDSAPKDFKIWSLESENDPDKFLIGEYRYDENGQPLQRFVSQNKDPRGTKMIEFEVNTNYGAAFTCLYRFRVHGLPVLNFFLM